MTTQEPLSSRTCLFRRWGLAAAVTAGICLLWFLYLNRDGCWLYWHRWHGLSFFPVAGLWLTLLIGLKMKGRIALLAISALALVFFSHFDAANVAVAESNTVGTLRQLRAGLESYKAEHQLPSYPHSLPQVHSTYPTISAYHFEYVPSVSKTGSVVGYIIEATPVHRACGCIRSFAIADDGQMYYTLLGRAATTSDQILQ